ncbi:hypothetical protein NUACC21_14150 [Scytonema sp. NUACC21]
MRRGGTISATAGNQLAGGNGANITINTRAIAAFLREDSDIRANAFACRCYCATATASISGAASTR